MHVIVAFVFAPLIYKIQLFLFSPHFALICAKFCEKNIHGAQGADSINWSWLKNCLTKKMYAIWKQIIVQRTTFTNRTTLFAKFKTRQYLCATKIICDQNHKFRAVNPNLKIPLFLIKNLSQIRRAQKGNFPKPTSEYESWNIPTLMGYPMRVHRQQRKFSWGKKK